MIRGKQVSLVAYEPEHAGFLMKWKSDPQYKYYFRNLPEILTIPQYQRFPEVINMNILMVVDNESNTVIGMCTYDNIKLIARSCKVGFIVDEAFQGQGYAKEIYFLFLNHLFNGLGFHKVYADMAEVEKATQAKCEWGAFKFEAKIRDAYFMNGEWHNDVQYYLLEDMFRKRFAKYSKGEKSWSEAKAEAANLAAV